MLTKAGGVEINSGGYCSSGDIAGDADVELPAVFIGVSAGIGGLTNGLL